MITEISLRPDELIRLFCYASLALSCLWISMVSFNRRQRLRALMLCTLSAHWLLWLVALVRRNLDLPSTTVVYLTTAVLVVLAVLFGLYAVNYARLVAERHWILPNPWTLEDDQ